MAHAAKPFVPLHEVEGIASTNVPAYSNRKSSIFNIGQHYVHGVYTGFQWQCVEYARRWLLLRKSCTFGDVPCACNIWNDIPHVERVTDGKIFRLRAVANGSPSAADERLDIDLQSHGPHALRSRGDHHRRVR